MSDNYRIRIPSEALMTMRAELVVELGRSVPSFFGAALAAYPIEVSDDVSVTKFVRLLRDGGGTVPEEAVATRFRASMADYMAQRDRWIKSYRDLRKL